MLSDPCQYISRHTLLISIILLMLLTVEVFPQQKRHTTTTHNELKTFENFLDKHPSVAADLKRDPSLINEEDYLAQHPELQRFLSAHPGLRREVMSKFGGCSMALPSIFDRVSPAVVYIYATSINPYRTTGRVEHVVGSGFIIDPSGLILTNSHVAFARQSLIVTLGDGATFPAQLVGADPIFDIALLRIPKVEGITLPTIALGDSDRVHVGGEAIAIGNPLGLDQSLSRGTVSATNRVLPATFFSLEEPLIQIDAPINPGNSGGPLINQCGEVIGITTAVIAEAQNIGFAIPINLVKTVLPSLVAQGRVIRPWLSFHGQIIDDLLQSIFRIPLVPGFLVEIVEPGSPAEKAGLKGGELEIMISGHEFLMGGDIITKINGISVSSPENMIEALKGVKVGGPISLNIFRDGKELTIGYVVPERPLLPGDVGGQNVSSPLPKRAGSSVRPIGIRTGLGVFRYYSAENPLRHLH